MFRNWIVGFMFVLLNPFVGVADTSFPMPTERSLPGGAEFYFLKNRGLPVFTMDILLPHGALSDPEGKEGLASMTAQLIDKGTDGKTREQIQDFFAQKAIGFSASADVDHTLISVSALERNWQEAVDMVAEILTSASFPEDQVAFEISQAIASLTQGLDSPTFLLGRAMSRATFEGTPFARSVGGTIPSLESLEPDDLKGFYRKVFQPRGAKVMVTSSMPVRSVHRGLQRAFSRWENRATFDVSRPEAPEFEASEQRQILLVHRSGLTQAHIGWARVGEPRRTAPFHAMRVSNQIIGGGLSTRLYRRIREELGLTYTIRSQFSFDRDHGMFSVRTFTQNRTVKTTIEEVEKLFSNIQDGRPFTEEEISSAKGYLTGAFPLALQRPKNLGMVYLMGLHVGNPLEEVNRFTSKIRKVDLEQAHRVAAEYFNPANLRLVVVGDRQQIESQLRALGRVQVIQASDLL